MEGFSGTETAAQIAFPAHRILPHQPKAIWLIEQGYLLVGGAATRSLDARLVQA
jgi:hypothetical protein